MKTFDTVAKLKLAKLKEGQFVETGGYYAKGDGGAARYLIVTPQSFDGYGDHELANGNVAVLQTDGSINVKEWGCVCDGATDDSLAFQHAVSQGGLILLPDNIHYTADITIPSNTEIRGLKPQTTIKGSMTAEGFGGYPTTLFTNSDPTGGNLNIKFKNINFDFAKGAFNYDASTGLTEKAGLKFENTDFLTFENCTFYDYVTNLDTSLTIHKEFGMMYLQNCNSVYMSNISTQRIREEVINAFDCKILTIDGWVGDGTTVNTSSFAGFWYCDLVSVKNASFIHQGGSVLNCYSRNVVYDNITVNAGLLPNGRGFDFGNELEEKNYEVNNIEIRNCVLNVVQYGITFLRFADNSDIIDNVKISNNKITVEEETGKPTIIGLAPALGSTMEISNNEIFTSHTTAIIDVGISLVGLNGVIGRRDITITNNLIKASNAINLSLSSDDNWGLVTVQNNKFHASDIGALLSSSGASVFFHCRATSAAGAYVVDNIVIDQNTAFNCAGGFYYASFDTTIGEIKNIQVTNNYGESDGTRMERNDIGFPTKLANNTMQFLNNTFLDLGQLTIRNAEHVRVENNQVKYTTEHTPRSFNLLGSSDYVDMINNRLYNVSSSSQNTVHSDLTTPKIGNVRGNYAERGVGTSFWASNITNTTLPN